MSDDKEIDSNEILQVANLMQKEVAKLDNYETRTEIISFLKDKFVAERMEASSVQEQAKIKILNKLIKRIEDDNLPFQLLLKFYEVVAAGGDSDLASILGTGGKGGVNLQINNNQLAHSPEVKAIESKAGDNPMKDMGRVIESIKYISESNSSEELKALKKSLDDEE